MNKQQYETPQVITYTAEEILEELGPAQANVYQKPDHGNFIDNG